jgi:hypothetical protein
VKSVAPAVFDISLHLKAFSLVTALKFAVMSDFSVVAAWFEIAVPTKMPVSVATRARLQPEPLLGHGFSFAEAEAGSAAALSVSANSSAMIGLRTVISKA